MAKRHIAILMDIDDKNTKDASGAARVDILKGSQRCQIAGADETYRVFINNSAIGGDAPKNSKSEMLDDAAHEIGHVLSSVFKIPGGMQDDPRQKGEFRGLPPALATVLHTPDQDKRILTNESLAWDIAEKIRPNLDQAHAKEALETYRINTEKRQKMIREVLDEIIAGR